MQGGTQNNGLSQEVAQKILASKQQQDNPGISLPPIPQQGAQQVQLPPSGDFQNVQALSQIMGFKPNSTFGFNMSGISNQPNSQMNLQQAMGNQSPLALLGKLFGL